MANKWLKKLQAFEDAVVGDYNPFAHIVRSPSPSVNFVFGRTHGIPFGYSALFFGPPKGGKTVLCNSIIGQFHKDYPEAIAVKFDTEMRELGQMTPEQAKLWGIDLERYTCYQTNSPEDIFDRIERDISAMIDEGAPIKLIIIDSISDIQGRRSMNADSVMTQQIGDDALTLQTGLKRILPTLRRKKIALIMTTHLRAELDSVQQMRGKKVRPAAGFAVQHFAEYFVFIEPNQAKEGKTDLSGKDFKNEDLKDVKGNSENIAHKIKVRMEDSSVSPKGRVGEFTLDYNNGIVNIHEEVYQLGVNRGVIQKPNNMTHLFRDFKWVGKENTLAAIKENEDLRNDILKEVRRLDVENVHNDANGGSVQPEESP